MPLRRSPPAASPTFVAPGSARTSFITHASQTCESDTSERSGSENVSVRHKRRRDDDDINELKNLITSLSYKFDQKFLELKQNNDEMKESLQFISDKYDTLLKTLHNMQESRAEDRKIIQSLEEKIEVLERKNRSTSLEIRNLPISLQEGKRFESKEDTSMLVKKISKVVGIDLNDEDIKDVYRVATRKEGCKPIVVELNSCLKKEKMLQGVKNFNKRLINEKLNTGQLNIPGPVKPVFISESLTPNAQKLYYAARQLARERGYAYCWTSRGLIYLRKAEGEPHIRINNEACLKLIAKP